MGFPSRYASNAPKPTFLGSPKQKREVFGTHANTAHTWAQQTLDHGRSGDGRMFWRGTTIYSYGDHYAIAAFTDGRLDGKRVVLFNSEKYSVSTSQHYEEARAALRGLPVVTMRVPYVDMAMGPRHGANAQWLLDQFLAEAKALANPRKHLWHTDGSKYDPDEAEHRPIVERRVAALPGLLDTLRDYCTAFRLDLYSLCDPVQVELEHAANIRAAFAKYEAGAPKRAKDAAKRAKRTMLADAALRGRVYAFIEGVGPPVDQDDLARMRRWHKWNAGQDNQTFFRHYHEAHKRAYPPPAYEPAKRLTVEQWQAGEGNATQYFTGRSDQTNTLCRRVAERLETSRGAVVPWPHAVKVFKRAQRCRLTNTSWHANGEKIPVGTFTLDAIEADGTIKAGCHVIRWDEMLRLAVREIPAEVKPTYPLPVPTGG